MLPRCSPAPASRSRSSHWRARWECCDCAWAPLRRSRSRARARVLGENSGLAERFAPVPPDGLLLAVFLSEGCHVCRGLEPVIEGLASDPVLSVLVFDEAGDAEVWRRLEVPGSPYAAALDLDGVALAKGSFNNLAQLESILATAERRRAAEEPIPQAHG